MSLAPAPDRPGTTRISVELVPRSPDSIAREAAEVAEHLPVVDTINVPDLVKFALRSWDACAVAGQIARVTPYRTIPHLRATDLDPGSPLPMVEALTAAGITEVLVVSGDAPDDFSRRTYAVDAVAAIRRLRAEAPQLRVYAGLDPYRQNLVEELDYAERKLEAGACGFFTQPFFDTGLMTAWAGLLPEGVPVWWGATTVTSPGSLSYWRRRNRVAFPATFAPTLDWHRDFARRAVQFARERGQNVYLMPVRASVREYLDGVL